MIPEAIDSLAMGQLGADHINDTVLHSLGQWGAIMAMSDTVFATLVSDNIRGAAITTLGKGMVLVGQFSTIQLTSGEVVAYNYTTPKTDIKPPVIAVTLTQGASGHMATAGVIPANCTGQLQITGKNTLVFANVGGAIAPGAFNIDNVPGGGVGGTYKSQVLVSGNGLMPYMVNQTFSNVATLALT